MEDEQARRFTGQIKNNTQTMKYQIVYSETDEGLEKEVNSLIEKGWTPIGGPMCIIPAPNSINQQHCGWFQAMAKL